MTSYLSGTLVSGETITGVFRSEDEARAELRSIERYRHYGSWLPHIFWDTADGQKRCLRGADFTEMPVLVGELAIT